jgi:STE24 endopeptidase
MRTRSILIALCLLLATATGLAAQAGPAPEGAPVAGRAGAAAAGSFDPEAATRAYLDRLSPEEKERSDSYFEGGYWLQLWSFLYGLGVAWLLLGTGLSVRMRNLAERITRRGPLQTAVYGLQYVLLTALLAFPLTVYTGFFREHQYDLATQGFGGWLRDWAVGLGVGAVMTAIALPVLYGVIRKAPRTWWLWGTGVGALFLAFVILVSPVYIDPLFNTYKPLEDLAVREPILSMARANGVPADEVWEFDASRQTTRISANVSGFLGTMRVRLNDNLLNRTSLPEILAVMGHELGHYVLNHIYELLIELSLILAGGFAFVYWGFGRANARWGGRWGLRGIGDVAGLPLLGVLLSVYFFAMTPVLNTVIRSNEAEADVFGLNAAREPDGFAEVALKLAEYRKLDPGPIEEWIFYDHPSGRARIRMAMEWKAEHLGEMEDGMEERSGVSRGASSDPSAGP